MWGFKKGGWFQAACTWHAHAAGMCIRDVGSVPGREEGKGMKMACTCRRHVHSGCGEVHRCRKKGRE